LSRYLADFLAGKNFAETELIFDIEFLKDHDKIKGATNASGRLFYLCPANSVYFLDISRESN
jgi:hypothetical protein